MWLEHDFVFDDYMCVVVVVSCVICCGCASCKHGDTLVPKMMCVGCVSWLCRVKPRAKCD